MNKWKKWSIIDITGRIVSNGEYTDMQKIDISALKDGLYFITMTDKDGMRNIGKFLKE
jgi:hypothetical protein